ncbi:hypothetical protein HDE76_000037 [Rhodanobacter sp. ANJX3]|uniref:hypothetical protein n=1 Tax=Rhodanobacter sp. ANJX3 TaxID=2723083 RepID=UPI00161198FF|nr:hypothetical protein [Rhodanobacter sp. ANJX3]MBB5356855.1 hypothetical protein [Rhodanobacter sp. ANJX3]
MPGTQYIGKAGHLAVMGEFCLRGYNAAMPEIDKGDDVFVVNDASGAMWRLQVKTALGKAQKTSRAYQFRVRETAIQNAQTPELHFIFVLRKAGVWNFLVMDRSVLRAHVRNNSIGTPAAGGYRQFGMVLHDDGRLICSGTNMASHLEDWATWPKL